MLNASYRVVVVGGGHAGAEAAWAAANLLPAGEHGDRAVGLLTLDPSKIGVMPCNPAIGGLAKGQIVREVDALGGLMGLAADATGIHFKMLNTSRGPAVRGPRCQCDKHAYASTVREMLESRDEIEIVAASVEGFVIEGGQVTGIRAKSASGEPFEIACSAVVLTTGTFMRGLMHTGENRTPGGRHGEDATEGMSATLRDLGFELGRLKTGTPPRLSRASIDWDGLEVQAGDETPLPFSDLTPRSGERGAWRVGEVSLDRFPRLEQVECRTTATNARINQIVRENLHRAPMYSGRIESVGPRYCPAIEDKVVRFEGRVSHGVFLEPESLGDDSVYCNGISTSLPGDVQEQIVRLMPGCGEARILREGYAVEYDMVRPHQIRRTCETKLVLGLFLAGQINGTSGYEEAAGQGLIAGVNAARRSVGLGEFTLGRDEAYIGVLMDDLVTKTPVEPYRMFTSRAEHRLILRADNSADRLTGKAAELGLLGSTALGRRRLGLFERRTNEIARLNTAIGATKWEGVGLTKALRRPEFGEADLRSALRDERASDGVWTTVHAEHRYAAYIERHRVEIRRLREIESRRIPRGVDYESMAGLRAEAAGALVRFEPDTFGQAGRLEGVTPADLTLLSVLLKRLGGGGSSRVRTA